MDQNEERIKNFYNKPDCTIVETYTGTEAWTHIVEIRYKVGSSRTRFKRCFRSVDKSNGFLVIYLLTENNERKKVGADYYFDKRDTTMHPNNGEINHMFQLINYYTLNAHDSPKILRELLGIAPAH
jgi:hypothetical protein